jgi:hypothetical protein
MLKIILVRFSMRNSSFQKKANILDEDSRNDWLEERIEIFNTVSAPSLAQHKAKVLLFLSRGDDWAYKKLDKHNKTYPVYSDGDIRVVSQKALQKLFPKKPSYILRMDSDDAIHKDFFEGLESPMNSYISQPWGIKWDGTHTSTFNYRNNPFITTYTNKHMTPFFGAHTELHKKNPVIVEKDPMWVHYIHGGNVSNTFGKHKDPFPADLTDFGLKGK